MRRSGGAFVAELRGLMHRLDVEQGRLYRATCDAELGDARCRVDLAGSRWRATGTVIAAHEPTRLRISLSRSVADGFFSGGRLVWTGGANDGQVADIRAHRRDASGIAVELWQAPPRNVAAGDACTLTAGCDKRFSTCRDKFTNTANFQGFPHMPGNDFVMRVVPDAGQVLDGGSLFG